MTKAAGLNHSLMLGLDSVAGRDLVWTRWSAADSVKDRIGKAGEVVGDAERATGIPNQNRIGLPSRERHFFGSDEVLAKWQLIGNGTNKAMAEIKVAVAGFKLLNGEGICISKTLLALITQSCGIVDGVRVGVVGGYCESVADSDAGTMFAMSGSWSCLHSRTRRHLRDRAG